MAAALTTPRGSMIPIEERVGLTEAVNALREHFAKSDPEASAIMAKAHASLVELRIDKLASAAGIDFEKRARVEQVAAALSRSGHQVEIAPDLQRYRVKGSPLWIDG